MDKPIRELQLLESPQVRGLNQIHLHFSNTDAESACRFLSNILAPITPDMLFLPVTHCETIYDLEDHTRDAPEEQGTCTIALGFEDGSGHRQNVHYYQESIQNPKPIFWERTQTWQILSHLVEHVQDTPENRQAFQKVGVPFFGHNSAPGVGCEPS